MPFISDNDIAHRESKEKQEQTLTQKVQAIKDRETAKKRFEETRKFTQQDLYNAIRKAPTNGQRQPARQTQDLKIDLADAGDIKDSIITIMSFPQKNIERRKRFATELKASKTVHDYIDNNIFYQIVSRFNDHMKFGVVYCLKFVQTNTDIPTNTDK